MSDKADWRSRRADLRPDRAYFWPEKANLKARRADLRSGRADFRPKKADLIAGGGTRLNRERILPYVES